MVYHTFTITAGERRNETAALRRTRQWLDDQHQSGRLLFSGPTSDRAYGIYIMLASNKSEAERIAAQDPHHVRGIRTMEVLEWNAHRAFRLNGPTIADVEHMAMGQ